MRFAFGVVLLILGSVFVLIGLRQFFGDPDPTKGPFVMWGKGAGAIALGAVLFTLGLERVGLTESDPIDWWKATPLSPDTDPPKLPGTTTTES